MGSLMKKRLLQNFFHIYVLYFALNPYPLKEDHPRIIPVKFGEIPTSGLGGDVVQSKLMTVTDNRPMDIRDMFHVYLNRFKFHFLLLHIIKTNKLCFFMHNGRVPGIAK